MEENSDDRGLEDEGSNTRGSKRSRKLETSDMEGCLLHFSKVFAHSIKDEESAKVLSSKSNGKSIKNAVTLLSQDNTVPFIARYRKERIPGKLQRSILDCFHHCNCSYSKPELRWCPSHYLSLSSSFLGLNEENLRTIEKEIERYKVLDQRRQTIVNQLNKQEKLLKDKKKLEELLSSVENATDLKELEEIYLPYKPKKNTLAAKARDQVSV